MDENKRDDILSEEIEPQEVVEETPAEESAPEETGASELEKELEELRDMFQQELDKASEEAENQTEELIQELDEPEEEALSDEEEFIGRPCEICGENPCAEEYGEDYPYCEECRNAMKKYPLRWSGVLMWVVMVAVFVATAYIGTGYANEFMAVSEYAAYYDSGKIMTALNGYYSYIGSATPEKISMKAVKDAIDGLCKTGYLSDAANVISTIYSEDDLKLPWNKKYANILKDSEKLSSDYYLIAEVIEPVVSGETDDIEGVLAELDALHDKTNDDGTPAEINKVFIEYYKYVVMSIARAPMEELLAQLKNTAQADKDGKYQWTYISNYCNAAAKSGDLELAESLFEKMVETSSEDTTAYVALAAYYRYADTPDPDKMLELCEEAKKNAAAGDVGYMTTMAIAYMLKGEGALALETMDSYMAQGSYTVQTCNLYALCALYNGNEEIYNDMKELLETSGYEISETVEAYKAGAFEIEEILTDKEGEI